ncbi:MAG: protease modulator HflC [Oscillospiraceae bacterium]|nr:protease modulator HflC [Oscillospiraceae bacterium]
MYENENVVYEVKEKKKSSKYLVIAIIAFILLIVASNSVFVLREGESALVQRFGRIETVYMRDVTDTVSAQMAERPEVSLRLGTGLKFKIPFIDNVIKYPSKLILYDSPPREVLTLDRHRLYFDNTAQWRIDNPLLFYEAYNNINGAKERIDDVLYSEMRISVGRLNSYVLISDRETSGQMLLDMAQAVSANFLQQGISVVDIRIKRTDLPSETYASIYNRMNTERQRVAAENRSEGERDLLMIRSETDRRVISITSEANRRAEEIRGEGDSNAARIYNEAYGRDPDFFEFYNLLDTYRQTVGSSSTLIVPLDSPFAKYLLGISADMTPPPPPPLPPQGTDTDGNGNTDTDTDND